MQTNKPVRRRWDETERACIHAQNNDKDRHLSVEARIARNLRVWFFQW
jgi:hypothetical protein